MYASSIPRQGRKRLRSNTKLTPWRDTWELEEVGRILLSATSLFALSSDNSNRPSSSESELQYALRKIAVWKARSDQGRIPHSMETTAALAELLYRDYYCGGDSMMSASSSTFELRLAYSCALMRGVNGIADNMQQNRSYASSVASLCDMVGLPGWLVDLRHDAAHNDLPSLSSLRLATQTFLVFLQNNYWTPMSTTRWELRKNALELLEQYKSASKTKGTSKTTLSQSSSTTNVKSQLPNEPKEKKEKQGEGATERNEEGKSNDNVIGSDNDSNDSDDTEEEWENDHDDNVWGKNLGTNQNRFMALLKDNSIDKKIKGNEKHKNNNNNNNKRKNYGNQNKRGEPSPLIHVKKFVKTIPMDIGFQVALSFLVWGGMGDVQPEGRGALIPGSPVSFPSTQEGANKIVNRYKDLIITLCSAWPGFASTLLIHLLDFILVIEDQEENKARSASGDSTANTGEETATSTKDHDNKQMKKMDPGSVRKLFFLSSWIKFLLSREFHMNYDKTVAIMEKRDNNGKSVDLSKKHSGQRSDTEANFLRSPAPLNILLEKAHYPLNTLCDRCCPEKLLLNSNSTGTSNTANMMQSSSSSGLKTDAPETASLQVFRVLCEILQNQRVVGLGIPASLADGTFKTRTIIIPQQFSSLPPPCKRHRHSDEEKQQNVSSPMSVNSFKDDTLSSSQRKEDNKNSPKQSSSKAEMSANKMSLDDLEALLSDTDDGGSDNGNSGSHDSMDQHGLSSHMKTKEINENKNVDKVEKEAPSVWVRCEVWDPCAIGTLPGLPV